MGTQNTIGRNIKKYRQANGFTQDTLASFLQINREEVSYYETGRREIPIGILSGISDLLGVELSDLFEEDEEQVNEALLCNFRTQGFKSEDLAQIAQFKAVVKAYLKMNSLIKENGSIENES